MVIEQEFPRFSEWLFGSGGGLMPAIVVWLLVMLGVGLIGILFAAGLAVISRGPKAGLRTVGARLLEGTVDLVQVSPRRVFGLSVLAVRQAMRMYVWIAFVMFLLILAFAAWFLNPDAQEPAKLFLSFVLTTTGYLILAVALFLSAFSLPNDFRQHTIYTVVTKPARPVEIVLGRILGFSFIGTVMLLLMGLISYVFVDRALRHEHGINGRDLQKVVRDAQGQRTTYFVGKTTAENDHAHPISRDPIDIAKGDGWTDPANGHYHRITEERTADASGKIEAFAAGAPALAEGVVVSGELPPRVKITSAGHNLKEGGLIAVSGVEGAPELNEVWVVTRIDGDTFILKDSTYYPGQNYSGGEWETTSYVVSQPMGMIAARVPIYADEIEFRDSDGTQNEGISVGFEWEYRRFIEGGTLAAAIWRFEGLQKEDFEHTDYGLPLELTFSVFRTHKGDIEETIRGDIVLRNPSNGLRSIKIAFRSNEYNIVSLTVPNELKGHDEARPEQERDLRIFDDLVDGDGGLIVEISCAESGQYFGMAKHDLYILARDASPVFNFFKGYFSIWMQMLLVCALGVMFSTFLNGFVALLSTGGLVLGGMFTEFIGELARGETYGGGPFESFYRVLTRAPMTTPLDESATSTVVQTLDKGIEYVLLLVARVLPDLESLSDVDYVSHGFNIPMNNLGIQFLTVLGFVIPLTILAHYILKGREVAR